MDGSSVDATSSDLEPAFCMEAGVDGCSGGLKALVYSDSLYVISTRKTRRFRFSGNVKRDVNTLTGIFREESQHP